MKPSTFFQQEIVISDIFSRSYNRGNGEKQIPQVFVSTKYNRALKGIIWSMFLWSLSRETLLEADSTLLAGIAMRRSIGLNSHRASLRGDKSATFSKQPLSMTVGCSCQEDVENSIFPEE